MNSGNRHIPWVIESEESRVRQSRVRRGRQFDFSPRQAFHYNDHPDAIIEDFDRSEYGAVLRTIERHVLEWERRQTSEQAEWFARGRRRCDLSTGEAAKAIVNAPHS